MEMSSAKATRSDSTALATNGCSADDHSAERQVDPVSGRSAKMTNISWSAPEALPFEQWVRDGRRLGMIGRGVGWWIGDWLRFGNARYGEKYVRAAKITGYDVQTLMNMVYVASNIEPARRRESLSWSHHAELASLSPAEQDGWMDRAEASRLSARDLRVSLRAERLRVSLRAERNRGEDANVADTERTTDGHVVCPECGCTFPGARSRTAQPGLA
jgi:hypothetical protein